jgi:hypothetical protein
MLTPPTKLQTFFPRAGLCRMLVDPKHDMDLVLCHFDALHQGANQRAFACPVRGREAVVALGRTVRSASNNQPQLRVECGCILALLGLLFEGGEALTPPGKTGCTLLLVHEPLGGAVDQPGEPLPPRPDLGVERGLLRPLGPARGVEAAALCRGEALRMGEQGPHCLPDRQGQASGAARRIGTNALAPEAVGIGAETAIRGRRPGRACGGLATDRLPVQGLAAVVARP